MRITKVYNHTKHTPTADYRTTYSLFCNNSNNCNEIKAYDILSRKGSYNRHYELRVHWS